mgnify:CR=1 FL=1
MLTAERRIEADEVWSWVRHAFDANSLSAARRYATLLPPAEIARDLASSIDLLERDPGAVEPAAPGEGTKP